MLDKIDEIYEYLDDYCVGMNLAYGGKFKRYVLQETKRFTSFHISLILGRGIITNEDRISGVFIVTVYKDYTAVNVLKEYKRSIVKDLEHEYDSFLVYSIEEFQAVFIKNMDNSVDSILHILNKKFE